MSWITILIVYILSYVSNYEKETVYNNIEFATVVENEQETTDSNIKAITIVENEQQTNDYNT